MLDGLLCDGEGAVSVDPPHAGDIGPPAREGSPQGGRELSEEQAAEAFDGRQADEGGEEPRGFFFSDVGH